MALRVARGLSRLWIVGTALFVIAVAAVSYSGIKAEFDAFALASRPQAAMPSFIAEARQQYPEYRGLNDAQLADAMYRRFYRDMPREQFERLVAEKIAASRTVEFQGQLHQFPADFSDQEIATALKSTINNPWASVATAAGVALGIPLVVLILGASLVWAFSGFSAKRP
jgi:hypothetical protein